MFIDDEGTDALVFIVAEGHGDLAALRTAGGHVEGDAADDIDVFRVLVLALPALVALHSGSVRADDPTALLDRAGAAPAERGRALKLLCRAYYGAGRPEECTQTLERMVEDAGHPLPRSQAELLASLGLGMGVAIMIAGTFSMDALAYIMDVNYERIQRDDLTVSFALESGAFATVVVRELCATS